MEYRLISVIALKGGTGFPERSQHHANRMKKRTRPVNSRHFRPTSWCTPTGWKSVKRSGQKSTIRWVSLAKHHLSNILRSPTCELIYIEREKRTAYVYVSLWLTFASQGLHSCHLFLTYQRISEWNVINSFCSLRFYSSPF